MRFPADLRKSSSSALRMTAGSLLCESHCLSLNILLSKRALRWLMIVCFAPFALICVQPLAGRAAEPPPTAWEKIAPFFKPPPEYAEQLGAYKSPLKFYDGRPVENAAD